MLLGSVYYLRTWKPKDLEVYNILWAETQGLGRVYYFRIWTPRKCILFSDLKTLEVYTIFGSENPGSVRKIAQMRFEWGTCRKDHVVNWHSVVWSLIGQQRLPDGFGIHFVRANIYLSAQRHLVTAKIVLFSLAALKSACIFAFALCIATKNAN